MLSILISAFLFIGCGGKDADSGTETEDTAAAEEQIRKDLILKRGLLKRPLFHFLFSFLSVDPYFNWAA